ncbi:MAG: M20/M25/M40 family metallo-hydrolase [Lachnospiraceae bacterium]|nr:M20/M25/M40 family metallo-hydrolase [Lachnospiraceae bacterium]
MKKKVLAYIEENQQEILHQLAKLVQIDTQNFRTHGNENKGQDYLEGICRELGLSVDRFTPASVPGLTDSPDYWAGRGADQRENLVAVFPGQQDENGIMLAAHMDTETVGALAEWSVDPFSGLIRDGKLYGRGSGDDKFGIIMAWAVIKALQACGFTPDKNILLGSYCDEEGGGGNGALGLCMKYPCETYVNLDGAEFESVASGGGCYAIDIWSTKKDLSVASVFDIYDGVCTLVEELKELDCRPGTSVRLSGFSGGEGGEKVGKVKFALYTDMTKEEAAMELSLIRERVLPKLNEWQLGCSEFLLRTRFFHYGKTRTDSREAEIMRDILQEAEGKQPTGASTGLTDLSIFLHWGSDNSFNLGMETGSAQGGGPHQVNEHIVCENLIKRIKQLALFVMRTSKV